MPRRSGCMSRNSSSSTLTTGLLCRPDGRTLPASASTCRPCAAAARTCRRRRRLRRRLRLGRDRRRRRRQGHHRRCHLLDIPRRRSCRRPGPQPRHRLDLRHLWRRPPSGQWLRSRCLRRTAISRWPGGATQPMPPPLPPPRRLRRPPPRAATPIRGHPRRALQHKRCESSYRSCRCTPSRRWSRAATHRVPSACNPRCGDAAAPT
mmetsp:Transcript_72328/g.209382  ORF Transcript_72328/g.209382 Transcript_72328/m.209382 type:complete len:206 (-) Transcript_72328:473-1090(-)